MVPLRARAVSPSREQVIALVGDVVAGAAIVLLAITPYPADAYNPTGSSATAIALLPAALMPFRRRWPIPILAACLALFGLAASVGTLAPGIALAGAVSMFAVAVRSSRRTTVLVTAFAVVGFAAASLLAAVGSVFDPRVLQLAITVAFAAAAGDATLSRREYIAAITERAVRAEQTRESEALRRVTEERLRIARDLHDAVAHQISVISLNAGVATSALDSRPQQALAALGTIRAASREVLSEIGDLLGVLRTDPEDASSNGVMAPDPGLEGLDDLIDGFRRSGLEVTVRREGVLSGVSPATGRVAYRVLKEALTNALKHGSPRSAHILLTVDNGFRMVVTNPVDPGSRPDTTSPSGGNGLRGIRERVGSVRGTTEAGIAPGGYRLAISLPSTAPGDL